MAKRKPKSYALAVRDQVDGRDAEPKATAAPNPIIEEARTRWGRCDESEDAQRKSILEAKKFRAGDQWPAAIRTQREGSTAIQGMAAQPPRPCLTIDRLSQPARQISNAIKSANFAIDVLPNGMGADTETADIFKGYLRRVQNNARGESPIEWAADQAIEGGIGWFRIRTEYVHESWDGQDADESLYDQELRLERIANNLTVYCDPSSVRPTRSDARFMFVTEDVSKDRFKSDWPHASLQGIEEFAATGDMKGWCSDDAVRIAEYWRVEYEEETWVQKADGSIVQVETVPKDLKKEGITRWRTIRKPIVKGCKISSTEVLEEWDWTGSRIPLVPIIGEELNVDGKPVLRGIIQEGMDAQRMVNYTYSGAMEIFALGPKSPYIVAEGQLEGYEGIWQTANTFNYSHLPYKPISLAGSPVPPPERQTAEAPIQAAVALMQVSEEAIKATTGFYASGLGDTTSKAVSGRAKQAEIQQSEIGSSNYPDNVKRALVYAGELMVEIIPKITRKGQILQILGLDDKPEQVIVGQPFQPGPNGVPQPVQMDPEQVRREKGMAKFFDLNAGRYSVTVSVGKASATKREEGAAALGELIPHLPPEMAMVATPDYVEQLSFPGSHQMAEKLRKALPPQLQDQEEGQGPDPEKQMLMQQLQQMQQLIESKQIEEQAKQQATTDRELTKARLDAQLTLDKAAIDNETKIKLAEMNNATSIRVAEINAASKGYLQEAEHAAQHEQQALNLSAEETARATEAHEAETQRAHEREMADVSHQQAIEQGAMQHQAALEQQAAKPQPGAKA